MDIRLIELTDAELLAAFYLDNQTHLKPWEPLRPQGHHTVDAWQARLKDRQNEIIQGTSAHFVSINPDCGDVIALCSLTNIVRGPFQACNIGYAAAKKYQGKGLMRQLCQHVIDYAFTELKLNRIMANYMPANKRSEKLLNQLGFIQEGLAKRYLHINGRWEDHILTSKLAPDVD